MDKDKDVYKTGIFDDPSVFAAATTLKQAMDKYNFRYNDFEYDGATSSYVKTSSDGAGTVVKYSIKFDANKKFGGLSINTTAPGKTIKESYNATYEQVTPALPVIDTKVNAQEFNDAITFELTFDATNKKVVGFEINMLDKQSGQGNQMAYLYTYSQITPDVPVI